jgi:TonB family protein
MSARVRGEEGVVQVLVTLREDGRVREAVVDGSSGFPSLDDAALRALRRARFRAKGARIEEGSQVLLTVRFQLTEPASR